MCLFFFFILLTVNFVTLMLVVNKLVFFQDTFSCTAEKFFNLLLNDDSNFTNEYRSARKDTNLLVSTKPAYSTYAYVEVIISFSHHFLSMNVILSVTVFFVKGDCAYCHATL